MPSILEEIVAHKRIEIETARKRVPLDELRKKCASVPPVRDFFGALSTPGRIKLIAEVKKASPSKGIIREDFEPVSIAKQYERGGADCLSVLTDERFFQGKLDYLAEIKRDVQIPILRKDFILDRYQLYEARSAGADAVLLIAECLEDCQLRSLFSEALDLSLTPLVESHSKDNLLRSLEAGATLVGVNNRDLNTFHTDLEHSLRMIELVPEECVFVSESGIHQPEDVERLASAGVDAILVGESLMSQHNVEEAVRRLLYRASEHDAITNDSSPQIPQRPNLR